MSADDSEKSIKHRNPLLLIGERFINSMLERFSAPHQVQRNRTVLLLCISFLLTLLLLPGQQFADPRYKVGDIASSDIRATQDYLLEDSRLTEKKRTEAEASVPYVYDFNATAGQEVTRRFEMALSKAAAARSSDRQADKTDLRKGLNDALGLKLTDTEFLALLNVKSDRSLLAEINRLTGVVYANRIVADARMFSTDLAHGVVLQDSRTCESMGALEHSFKALDTAKAREILREMRISGGLDPHDQAVIKGILDRSLIPNLIFNRNASEEKRHLASSAVSPVLYQLKRGEMIVRSGEKLSEEQVRRLDQIFAGKNAILRFFTGVGVFCLVLILFYFPYRFARKNIRKFSPGNKDLVLISLITLFSFALLRTGLMISTAMEGLLSSINSSSFYYLFPFALAPMLVRIILNSEVALVYCAVCAPLAGIMFDGSITIVIYALMGGVVGAHGVRHCKDRGVIYTAGLKVSVVNVAMAVSFQILNGNLFSVQTLYCAAFALIGGVVTSMIVTGIIPPIENIFQYTTDMKLLEYSNLNAPLLHELMVRAPGTYHHSVLVGNLVEAAAEAIHANPLLARVAAYYHDIGKVSKPLYFIENVKGGDNRHDKLSPNMSALILIAHVKEGVELAREYRLGQPIIDIIRQSHGTGLISFFFQKAKTQAADPMTVNDQDFRYPGPKPQTREAGLVLLADAVEAASRTLSDPTPARIQGLVQKIINNIFIDGQLDECELTLKNLHEIAKSFNRVLNGIYHHRIDYPEPAYKDKTGIGRKPVEHSNNEPPASSPDSDEHAQKSSGEGLKRLGRGR